MLLTIENAKTYTKNAVEWFNDETFAFERVVIIGAAETRDYGTPMIEVRFHLENDAEKTVYTMGVWEECRNGYQPFLYGEW